MSWQNDAILLPDLDHTEQQLSVEPYATLEQ